MYRSIDPPASLRLAHGLTSDPGAVDEVEHVNGFGGLERGERLATHDHLLDDLPIVQHSKTPAVSTFLSL